MKIRKAIKLAKDGKKIARKFWDDGTYCTSSGGPVHVYLGGKPTLEATLWCVDILADDWEVVE